LALCFIGVALRLRYAKFYLLRVVISGFGITIAPRSNKENYYGYQA